jgi:hypothetical protein
VEAAFVYTGLGDRTGALNSLESAFARYETDVNYVAVDPIFDALRGEPGLRL